MGKQSRTNPRCRAFSRAFLAGLLVLLLSPPARGQASTPLLLPSALVYDAAGNLYFSETNHHVIRRLAPDGTLSTLAGTGAQGFAGDGSSATAALLDSPGALALDAAGDLFVGDTHNHRVRRVDAATGIITTALGTGTAGFGADGQLATATAIDLPSALVFDPAGNLYVADQKRQVVRRVDRVSSTVATIAGNGVQGSQGDGGPALAASLDSPAGLAIDAAGNLFISDAHNQRVRRVDALTGRISTVAGTGVSGYGEGSATLARLRLPRGLAVDSSGALYVVDSGNNRLRRVDPVSGQLTTIAGGTAQGFAGDGGAATQAALDTPRGVTITAAGLPTFADGGNARVRQVDANSIIQTIAGIGAVGPAGLILAGPSTAVYGNGVVTASLGGGPGSGTVSFLEGTTVLGTVPLAGSVADFSTASLPAGSHSLSARFSGDASHAALQSNTLNLLLTPDPVTATPDSVSQVYGLPIPALTGVLSGVLARDAGSVQVAFTSVAAPLSGAGTYPISATLGGTVARNYALTTTPAVVTVIKAPSATVLSSTLLAHIASGTSGQPGGSVTLLDGGAAAATLAIGSTGDVQFSAAGFSSGSHTLSASYAGDPNFLPSLSSPVMVTVGSSASADFAVASAGAAAVTVPAGSAAIFTFLETPLNGGLSSPIVLSASGLPAGATAVFSPAYLPPGSGPATFTLTVQTIKTAGMPLTGRLIFAGLLAVLLLPRRHRRLFLPALLVITAAGCGDRVNSAGQQAVQSRTYNITVNATSTSSAGTTLLHSVTVTLTTE